MEYGLAPASAFFVWGFAMRSRRDVAEAITNQLGSPFAESTLRDWEKTRPARLPRFDPRIASDYFRYALLRAAARRGGATPRQIDGILGSFTLEVSR